MTQLTLTRYGPPWIAGICMPIAAVMFACAVVLYRGLPAFYRTSPPRIAGSV